MDDLLSQLAHRPKSLRVGVIGAGKFATMFTTQVRHVEGLELAWVADLDLERARAAGDGAPVGTDAAELIAREEADVVVEATGSPRAGARHALAGLEHGQHVVMVTVEADVLVGPALARRTRLPTATSQRSSASSSSGRGREAMKQVLFEEDGAFRVGTILSEAGASLRVILPTSRNRASSRTKRSGT